MKYNTFDQPKKRLVKIVRAYLQMIDNCYNANSISFFNYGDRGITVCDEWLESPAVFFNWADEQWPNKEESLQLFRIDMDKGYSPENCRYVAHGQAGYIRQKKISVLEVTGELQSKD